LGAVATGETTGALALAEETGRWEPDGVRTTAERVGDGWRLRGEKHYVADGDRADEIAVVAVAEGELSLFVVPRAQVAVAPLPTFDATRAHVSVVLDDVVVEDRRAFSPGRAGPG